MKKNIIKYTLMKAFRAKPGYYWKAILYKYG